VIEGYGKADEGTEEFRAAFKALKPLFKKVFDNFDTKVAYESDLCGCICVYVYALDVCVCMCVPGGVQGFEIVVEKGASTHSPKSHSSCTFI
jgi:hypothetical protein